MVEDVVMSDETGSTQLQVVKVDCFAYLTEYGREKRRNHKVKVGFLS